MTLTETEQHVLAYWLAGDAAHFNMSGRFFPHGELVMILTDKIQVATRPFGRQASAAAGAAAREFLDAVIAKGGFSTTQNKFGGSMHQYQADAYPKVLVEMREAEPLVGAAAEGGEQFWASAFARLSGS